MTKQIFAKGVSKVVPVVGGVVSGGLTYATFKPSCNRLKKSFWNLNLSDPEFYKKVENGEIKEEDLEKMIIDIDESDIEVQEADEENEVKE